LGQERSFPFKGFVVTFKGKTGDLDMAAPGAGSVSDWSNPASLTAD
jgi:hypothetical protein